MIEILLVFAIVALLALVTALLWRRRSRLAPEQTHEQGYGHGGRDLRREDGPPSP
jgi:type II secretory pathway pseudopilin PulG